MHKSIVRYSTAKKKLKRILEDFKRNASDLTYLRDNADLCLREDISQLLASVEWNVNFLQLLIQQRFENQKR